MSAGSEVTIAGHVFRLGATYRARPGVSLGRPFRPRRLLHHTLDSLLPGGRVTVACMPSGREHVMAGTEGAAWAGEPVGDVGRGAGTSRRTTVTGTARAGSTASRPTGPGCAGG